MGQHIMVDGLTRKASLTRQQAHIICEFGDPKCVDTLSSETLAVCGVREWPTCSNLIAAGLIVRTAWQEPFGYVYDITDEGREVLANLREMNWR